MKNIFSDITHKIKNSFANSTTATKIKYGVVSLVFVGVAGAIITVSAMNIQKQSEPADVPDSTETMTIEYDTETVIDMDDFEIADDETDAETEKATEDEKVTESEDDTTEVTEDKEASEEATEKTEETEDANPETKEEEEQSTPSEDTEKTDPTPTVTTPEEKDPTVVQAVVTKPVAVKPAETKPAETMPAETKPAETKPVETKPAATQAPETKPAVTQPAATKPVETKPAETKPVVTTPATKPANSEPVETNKGGMLVKQKVYDYHGNNVAILDITNQTEKTYVLTIKGNYKDASGNVIKTETRVFDGYPAGYQNYFVFNPGIPFDSFSFELSGKEFSGVAYAQYFRPGNTAWVGKSWGHVDETGRYIIPIGAEQVALFKKEVMVDFNISGGILYKCDKPLSVNGDVVIFDKNGELYLVEGGWEDNQTADGEYSGCGVNAFPPMTTGVPEADKDKYNIPDNLTSVTGFYAVKEVFPTFEGSSAFPRGEKYWREP